MDFMLEVAKMIHHAIGYEFPRLFMLSLGLVGLLGGLSVGWVIDRAYKNTIHNAHLSKVSSTPARKSTTDGHGGKGGGGDAGERLATGEEAHMVSSFRPAWGPSTCRAQSLRT